MNDAAAKSFYLGDWRVSPQEGLLTRDDTVVHLEPKAMEVLVYMASRAGEVITREDLERDVWRGALVGYDAVTNTVIKLRKALQDSARQSRYIATIPKRGYQLIATVSDSGSIDLGVVSGKQGTRIPSKPLSRLRTAIFGLGIVAMLLLVSLAWLFTSNKHDGPPSIAVLPFENLNKDPKQDYLADGVTEDLITDLSKLSNIRVISNSTTSAYKDKQDSVTEIGSELGVTYVVKGNVRQVGDNFRVNVQLVNANTGFNAWASRYDRDIKELFNIQDDVSRNIVRALSVKVSSQEESRLAQRSTNSLKAYDYFQEGMRRYRTTSREGGAQAREFYRKAIEIDPAYGRAYGAIAVTLAMDYRWGWTDTPIADLDKALTLARKAVELDPASPQTYWALGFVQMARRDHDGAKKAALQSIDVAPNYADGYGLLGWASIALGEARQGVDSTKQGMRLNPYYTWEYLSVLGQGYYMLRDYANAVKALEEADARNGNIMQVKAVLAASYVRLGRKTDAEWVVEQLKLNNPEITVSHIQKTWVLASPASINLLAADLKRVGLPD